jgi:hypothetical protein
VTQPIEFVGFWSRGPFRVETVLLHQVGHFTSPHSPKKHNALKAVGFEGRLEARRNRDAYALSFQLNRPYPSKTRFATRSSLPHFLGPVPLVQRRSGGPSGPRFPLCIFLLCLKSPISPRLPPVPRWLPPAYSLLVRLPGIPIFTGRFHSSAKFTQILLPKMACILLHTHGHTTGCSTLSIMPGTSPRPPPFFHFLTRFKHPTGLPSLP